MKIKIMYQTMLVFLLTILSVNYCFAALPSEIKTSDIKAIATVKDIKTLPLPKPSCGSIKYITFKLEKPLGNSFGAKEFSGYCGSIQDGFGTLTWLDELCFPIKNEKVFVTIIHNDGRITSYTPLSKKLETNLIKNFDKMKYLYGRIYYDN